MDYVYQILVFVCIFAMLAGSYNLLIGYSGLFSIAHAAFFGLGAYTTALLTASESLLVHKPLPVWLAMLMAMVVAAVFGLVIALPALRVNSDYLVVLSFGFQMVVVGLFLNWIQLTGGETGIAGVPRPRIGSIVLASPVSFLIYTAVLTALCYYVLWRVTGTSYGRLLKAVRDDQVAAASIGKNIVKTKIEIFCFASALAGLAGALFAQYVRVVSPQSFLINVSVEILAMLILGGTANMVGSLVGATLLSILPEILRFMNIGGQNADQVRLVAFGFLLILILRFRPQGLLPEYWQPGWVRRRLQRAVQADLDSLHADGATRLPEPVSMRPAPAELNGAMVTVRNVSKSFGGIKALNGFSTTLERGKITSLIGPNGAGKTTAFNVITGFLAPDEGSIVLSSRDITQIKPHKLPALGVARSFQNLRLFYQMTVLDNVMVAIPGQRGERLFPAIYALRTVRAEELKTRRTALQILKFVGLEAQALELAENLSYAEAKLLVLARMLAVEADLLLLDEPASGLDPNSLDNMFRMIRQLADHGKTICIIEHNLDVIKELSDKVVFLDEGSALAEGTVETILQNRELAERYFGS